MFMEPILVYQSDALIHIVCYVVCYADQFTEALRCGSSKPTSRHSLSYV